MSPLFTVTYLGIEDEDEGKDIGIRWERVHMKINREKKRKMESIEKERREGGGE